MTKFLVDRMLGQTAKWLRLMGIDAEYAPPEKDDKILELARKEDRIIITRDRELSKKDRVFLVPNEPAKKIIPFVLETYSVDIKPMTRCSRCNSIVEKIDKSDVEEFVPEGVLSWCDDYWKCTGCGQVYWKGTHWDEIMTSIEEMLKDSR